MPGALFHIGCALRIEYGDDMHRNVVHNPEGILNMGLRVPVGGRLEVVQAQSGIGGEALDSESLDSTVSSVEGK